jgi:hypothetical protein
VLKPEALSMLLTARKPKTVSASSATVESLAVQTHFLSHLIFLLLHSEQLCTILRRVA